MGREFLGAATPIISLGLCLAFLSGCGAMRQMREDHVAVINQNLQSLFATYEGRFGEAEMQACLANHTGPSKIPTIVGKPVFKPNHFLTCASNTGFYVGWAYRPEDTHVLIYEVSAPTSNPPPEVEAMKAVGVKNQWMVKFNCAYRANGDKIEAFKEERFGVFFTVKAVPSQIPRNDPCMALPNADSYVRRQ